MAANKVVCWFAANCMTCLSGLWVAQAGDLQCRPFAWLALAVRQVYDECFHAKDLKQGWVHAFDEASHQGKPPLSHCRTHPHPLCQLWQDVEVHSLLCNARAIS